MLEMDVLIDIPHVSILDSRTGAEIIDEALDGWQGLRPTGVALPLIDDSGVYVPNDLAPACLIRQKSIVQYANEFSKLGATEVFLTVTPSMGFLPGDKLHVVDIVDDSSAHACVMRSGTRRILDRLVHQALEQFSEEGIRVAGLALNITDIWPMGSEKDVVQPTCFCRDCRSYLAAKGVEMNKFDAFPPPWNLVLQGSDTGIAHISKIPADISMDVLVSKSTRKGFATVFAGRSDLDLRDSGRQLLAYMKAREAMTLEFIKEFFKSARTDNEGLKRIVITEGLVYNWTSGVFYSSLDDKCVCDELWCDPTEECDNPCQVDVRSYMWSRSRYTIDAFMSLLRQNDLRVRAMTELGQWAEGAVQDRLLAMMGLALSGRLSGNWVLETLDRGERFKGIVVAAMTAAIANEVITLGKRGEITMGQSAGRGDEERRRRGKKPRRHV